MSVRVPVAPGERRTRVPRIVLAGAALVCLGTSAQEPPLQAPPTREPPAQVFPGEVEQVTVDVVVLDKRGEPVTGLTKADFTVLDEGSPRPIESFDVVAGREPARGSTDVGPARRVPVASNTTPPADRGRLFVIVFDELHLSPLNAHRAKAAVASFVEKGTRDGDQVLLIASGGSAWWSARLPAGRSDLLAVLKYLDGRRIPDSAGERLTDHEAVQIYVYRNSTVAFRVLERFERFGTTSRSELQQSLSKLPINPIPGSIDMYVESRAADAYFKLKSRMDVTLGVLERCFEALETSRDRKAILLVSEGFANDPTNERLRRVTEGARRANAALYFIDTRGLQGLSQAYSAEFGAPFAERDLMAAIADVSLEGDGAAVLADDTGGFSVRNTNDFAGGAARIGRESRSYYLLGYSPGGIPRDGRFRKIDVRVRGKGLTVRARKGYYAPADGQTTASREEEAPRDRELQRALDAPGMTDGIPLRMTSFALDDAGQARTRVLLAAEADLSKVDFPSDGGNAVLDTLAVVAHRESGEFLRNDQKVELQRRGEAAPTQPVWYAFVREFELRPGAHQARLVVRDAASRRVGSLILELEVPSHDGLRVSTPVLTDTLQKTPDGGLTPALVVRRAFASSGQLYCRFDVFGAARGPDGQPQVKAGHALRRPDGTVLGSTPPHIVQPTSIGALSRLIQIPLGGTAPGDYELVLTVSDEISGQTRELVEPFSVTPPVTAGR